MKWFVCLVVAAGCQRGDAGEPAPVPTALTAGPAYAQDIASLCESMSRSGADKIEPEARQLTIATWLGNNLKTPESRQFLVRIQPLEGDAKAEALITEAKRVGLTGCALAAEWHTPR